MQAKFPRRLAIGLVVAVSLYALGGFVAAPLILERQLDAALGQQLGRPVEIGRVRVNPFTFIARITDLRVGGTAAPRLHVPFGTLEFSPASPLRPGWHLRALELDAPQIRLTAGKLPNPAALLTPGTVLRVARTRVRDGTLLVATGEHVYRLTDVELSAVMAETGGVPFELAAKIDANGALSARGTLAQGRIGANVSVDGLDVAPLSLQLPTMPNVTVAAGLLTFSGSAQASSQGAGLSGSIALADVELADANSGETLLTVASVHGEDITMGEASATRFAGSMTLDSPIIEIERSADDSWQPRRWWSLASGAPQLARLTGRVQVRSGRVILTDRTITPPVILDVGELAGTVEPTDNGARVAIDGRITAQGRAAIRANWETAAGTPPDQWSIELQDVPDRLVSPYLERAGGYAIEGDALTLAVAWWRGEAGRRARLLARMGEARIVPGAEATGQAPDDVAPILLAAALLRDRDDVMTLQLDLPPGADPGAAFRKRVVELATAPFVALGAVSAEAGIVSFSPGDAAIEAANMTRLEDLAAALKERPALAIEIPARFDPRADRNALADRQVRLHVALATSAVPPGAAAKPDPPRFDDPRVITVLDEFAVERLPAATLDGLRGRYPEGGPDYYAAAYKALVDAESISERTLKNLARFRARSIAAALRSAGLDAARVVTRQPEAVPLSATQDASILVNLELRPCADARPCRGDE